MTLSLYYPTKPYVVTQAWGVPNDAYLRFGFSKHNGVDCVINPPSPTRAMCDGTVVETGYNPNGSGIYIIYKTDLVNCEEIDCFVYFYYMHAKTLLKKKGDFVRAGDALTIPDSTGFSTGNHLHITAYRLSLSGERLDTDPTTNYTFDHSKYFNGLYASDLTPPHTFNDNLSFGMVNHEVQALQVKLGIAPEYQTGNFFGRTLIAVMKYQSAHGITPTGFVGPLTRAALNKT